MTIDIGRSAIAILATLAVVAGSILLVVYAVRRGLVHRDLDGTDATEGAEGTMPAGAGGAAAPSRTLGLAGVTLLVAGIALGAVGVVTSSGGLTSGAPGNAPTDCAQSWNGCPQATANPQVSPNP
jgi:hypothetical protein